MMDHQVRKIHLTAMLENSCTPEELAPALEIGNIHETPGMQNEEPIHAAAWHSSYTVNIDLLLAHGADINARDEYQETPLFYAVKGKYPEIMIPYLLAKGADIEARNDYQQTPFLTALDYCDDPIPVITLLKNAGCDLSVTDEDGNGALDLAAMYGNSLKLFETLYEFGCVSKSEVPDENRHPDDDPHDDYLPFLQDGKRGLKKHGEVIFPPVFDEISKWPGCNVIYARIGHHAIYFDCDGKVILKNRRNIGTADDMLNPYCLFGYRANVVMITDWSDAPRGDDFCECRNRKTGLSRKTLDEYCQWLTRISNIVPFDIKGFRIKSRFSDTPSSYIVQSGMNGTEDPLADCIMQLKSWDLIETFNIAFTILVPMDSRSRKVTKQEAAVIHRLLREYEFRGGAFVMGISKGRTSRIKSGVMVVMTQFIYDRPPWREDDCRV